MPTPLPTPMPPPEILHPSAFLERLIRLLLPYFLGVCPDLDAARAEILETLASYGARTRSEMLNAAEIIAYGLSGLDALFEAKTAEMSPSLRLRYRGCANNLSRSCQKAEQMLTKRLASDLPQSAEPHPEPVNDMPQPEVQQAIQAVQATIATYRNRPSANHPTTSPQAQPASQDDHNNHLWDGAMINALAQMGMPVQPTSTA
jgi:hypothetical protein